jgi:hypothetical protein
MEFSAFPAPVAWASGLLKQAEVAFGGVCSKKFELISPKTDKSRGAGGIPARPSFRPPAEGDLFGLDDFKFF